MGHILTGFNGRDCAPGARGAVSSSPGVPLSRCFNTELTNFGPFADSLKIRRKNLKRHKALFLSCHSSTTAVSPSVRKQMGVPGGCVCVTFASRSLRRTVRREEPTSRLCSVRYTLQKHRSVHFYLLDYDCTLRRRNKKDLVQFSAKLCGLSADK